MGKAVEREAATVEEAIRAALSELGCAREDAEIDVLQQATGGFFGFFSKPARVRVTEKEKADVPAPAAAPQEVPVPADAGEMAPAAGSSRVLADPERDVHAENTGSRDFRARMERMEMEEGESHASYEARLLATNERAVNGPLADKAERFLHEIFEAMQMDVAVTRSASSDGVIFNLSGDNLGILIGKHGQTLDSLQYLANLVANRTHEGEHLHLILDIEDYRARRETTLMRLAGHLADKACSIGQEIHLEPMTRHERKIIHMALQGNRRVTSYSAGVEPRRYVVIVPKRHRRREDSDYEHGAY
ncbi:RNA-binding cell elongation regulator Jag/EloR [uncultured Mitsuokella sp.]|uniref:RNA-binding cell elongation regulator Jag/EloR n=1 Tax=uncultured Mitsuokella sp. TaxID=453120 RepID=UPI00263A01E2|nr:RNA-binding cell elongation regulator Jag/EloR [uncultured Mitsuokella sp.]